MPYATQDDMTARFGEREMIELTDRDNTAGEIVPDVLTPALDDAVAEIDSYLQSRYALPLSHVPAALIRIACDIARFRLYDDEAPEAVSERYQSAVKFLKSIATGQLSLGPSADGEAPTASGTAEMVSGGRIFGRDDESFI